MVAIDLEATSRTCEVACEVARPGSAHAVSDARDADEGEALNAATKTDATLLRLARLVRDRTETRPEPGPPPQPDGADVRLLLTVPEAARALGLGRSTVYELIGAGRLEVVHIGRAARVPVDALDSFVTSLRHSGRPRIGDAGGRRGEDVATSSTP